MNIVPVHVDISASAMVFFQIAVHKDGFLDITGKEVSLCLQKITEKVLHSPRRPRGRRKTGRSTASRSAGSSETPYSTLLTLCLKTSDEETELEFTDSVIKEGVMNASLLMFMQMLLCSTDFDSVIDKILEFLMSQLSDEKNKEAVLNVI